MATTVRRADAQGKGTLMKRAILFVATGGILAAATPGISLLLCT